MKGKGWWLSEACGWCAVTLSVIKLVQDLLLAWSQFLWARKSEGIDHCYGLLSLEEAMAVGHGPTTYRTPKNSLPLEFCHSLDLGISQKSLYNLLIHFGLPLRMDCSN